MPLDPPERVALVRGLLADRSRERELEADKVTDLRSELEASEAHLIALVLAAAAVAESDGAARESQLHALAELHEWDLSTPDASSLIASIDRDSLAGSEIEYVSYLLREAQS